MKRLLLLLIPFLFFSCATTNISSFRNPDIDFSNYKKIVVFGNSRDIAFRKTMESDLVSAFCKNGVEAVSGIEIINPVKEYSDTEVNKILLENNIDGCLSVIVISSTEEKVFVPQTTTTTYSSKNVNGQIITVPHTSTYGGYTFSYPKASFEIVLKDLSSGQIAFKATANSEGNDLSDMDSISKSLAAKIVKEYLKLSKENK